MVSTTSVLGHSSGEMKFFREEESRINLEEENKNRINIGPKGCSPKGCSRDKPQTPEPTIRLSIPQAQVERNYEQHLQNYPQAHPDSSKTASDRSSLHKIDSTDAVPTKADTSSEKTPLKGSISSEKSTKSSKSIKSDKSSKSPSTQTDESKCKDIWRNINTNMCEQLEIENIEKSVDSAHNNYLQSIKSDKKNASQNQRLQRVLVYWGFLNEGENSRQGRYDGIIGSKTITALKDFLRANALCIIGSDDESKIEEYINSNLSLKKINNNIKNIPKALKVALLSMYSIGKKDSLNVVKSEKQKDPFTTEDLPPKEEIFYDKDYNAYTKINKNDKNYYQYSEQEEVT